MSDGKNGKGDKRRPREVPYKDYSDNYDRIYGPKKEPKEEQEKGQE